MKVLLTLEDHLNHREDGHFYVEGPADYSAWSELLDIFDEVLVLARASNNRSQGDERILDGPSISVYGLPDFVGPWQYLIRLSSLQAQVRLAVAACDAFILRVPGLISRLVWNELKGLNRPYGVELVGDPWDAMAPGTMRALLRPLYRRLAARNMKKICRSAASALYWSRETLQRRYPPGLAAEQFISPRVILNNGFASPDAMTERLRRIEEWSKRPPDTATPLRIGYVGSFAQLYKGPDTLLYALSLCRRSGLNFNVFFAGEGKYRRSMEKLAQRLSLGERATFLGQISAGDAIFQFLDGLDLFVMPSRAEGFGRAFLEAMARGCPCIGSTAGSIPELLEAEDLVPPGNARALAHKILTVTGDVARMQRMSLRNLEQAKEFGPDLLRDIRRSFYKSVKHCSPLKPTLTEAIAGSASSRRAPAL